MNATLDLIDKRLRHALDVINGQRMIKGGETLRFDLDIPERGYLGIREDMHYHVRSEMRFAPLLTIVVTYKQNVYYFDVRGPDGPIGGDIYNTLKYPPNRKSERNETFWLSTELDTPMEAIVKYMYEVLV